MNRKLRNLLQLVMLYSPDFITKPLSERAQQNELKHALEVSRRTRVTREQVEAALAQFTIDTDVMLHSSMIKIGKVQGGAKFLAESITQTVDTSRHTLLVSALPYRGMFAKWLTDDMVFDVRTAPIAMGTVNEKLADYPGACRSIHPTHSVVSLGPDAQYYVGEHHLDNTPFGEHSPYYKLIARHGKILLFGATLNNITFVHAIEDALGDAFPVKVYNKRRYRIRCIDGQGNELFVNTPVHNPVNSIKRNFGNTEEVMTQLGAFHSVPLGESAVSMLDCYEYTMAYLDYLLSGHSLYGRHKVTQELRDKIQAFKDKLNQG